MSREQLATVKAHIEAELRAVEGNPKSTKQVKDRVAKLLAKAAACLEQVPCARSHALRVCALMPVKRQRRYLLCDARLSLLCSSPITSVACLPAVI